MDGCGLGAARVEAEGEEADGDVEGFAGDLVAVDLVVDGVILAFIICGREEGTCATYKTPPAPVYRDQTEGTRATAQFPPIPRRHALGLQVAVGILRAVNHFWLCGSHTAQRSSPRHIVDASAA